MLLEAATKTLTQLVRAGGGLGEALQQVAKIEASAGREDWRLFSLPKIFENFQRTLAILAGGEYLVGFHKIDQVMRYGLLFGAWNFRRADIESTINLGGIAHQDLAVQLAGKSDPQRRLARRGRPEHDNQRRCDSI